MKTIAFSIKQLRALAEGGEPYVCQEAVQVCNRRLPYPLPVRQASALPAASFRFAVTRDTLAVQLTLPLAG